MATSYTRQSSFADGDTITAALFNNEYNQLLNAFAYASSGTTGHRHDGSAGEGGNIHTIGDQDFLNKIVADSTNNRWGVFVQVSSSAVEQIRFQDGAIVPVTDNDIDLGTSSVEFKDAYFDGTVTTDALVADTADINGGSVDGATVGANSASSGAFTTLTASGNFTGSGTIEGTTITATTAFVPDASDGAALGTSSLEFSDLFLADGAVINFGDDQDVTLTHVADTGLLLSSTDQLQFGDSGTYIHQSADGVLDLVSDTEIELTATTIDINGAVAMDGAMTGGTNITISGELDAATLDISGNADIDGTTNLDAVDIDGAVQIDATVTVGEDDTGYDVKFFGDTASAYMLWDTSEDDLILGGAARVVVPASGLVIGSTAVTSTAAELNLLDGVTSTTTELNYTDTGAAVGTVVASKAVIADANKDVASFRNVTLTGELDAATLDISGDADIDGTTNLDAVDIDGAVQIDGTVTVGVDDTGYDVKFFGATSGSYLLWDESADSVLITDSTPIKIGDSQDMTLYHDGSNSYLTNATGALKIATETSGIAVTIGHTTSETTVADNLTVTGNASIGGDLDVTGSFDMSDANITNIGSIALDTITNDGTDITLDSSGDIILDADGADIFFKDAGTTFGSATNSSGNLILKSGTTTALTFSGANVTAAGTVTAGGILKTDDATEATSTTDGSLQTDGGLSVVKDAVFGDDVKLLSDAAVLNFGADSDVNLTHVADTGLLLNSTMQLQFNDASQYINAPSATVLDINATDEVEINATLADVNANLDVSGTYTGGGLMTTGGNIVIPDTGNIGSASDTDAIAIASNGVVTFSQAPVFPDGSIAVADLDIDGATDVGADLVDADLIIVDDGAGGTNRKATLSRLKTYIGAGNADDLGTGDAAVTIATSSGNITIDNQASDADIIFKGTDGGADITALTLDMSAAGAATFNDKIVATELDISGNMDIDGTSNLDAVDIDGAVQIDNTVTVGADDTGYDVKFFGATSGAYMLWDESADDLILAGAARAVVPDGQLVLGSTAVSSTAAELNLLDGSSANSVVNSKAVVYGSSGELAGTLSTAAQTNVTSLGTLTALTVDDVAVDGKVITMTGSTSDTAVFTVGTNGTLSIVTTDDAAAAANITITADGTFEADGTTITLDSGGDIVLDADGADVIFKDDGTSIGTFTNSSSDFVITSNVQDKDIIFKGDDGGSAVTALTLDMSGAGRAIFNAEIRAEDGTVGSPTYSFTSDTDTGMFLNHAAAIGFVTQGSERVSIDGSRLGVANTTPSYSFSVASVNIAGSSPTGNEGNAWLTGGNYYSSSDSTSHMIWNDCSASAGTHNYVLFRYQGGTIGDIDTVDNSTIRYNTFTGAHWSQFEDGAQPELKLGTVLSTVDELMEWTHYRYTESLEDAGTVQEVENKVKIAGTHSLLVNKEISIDEDGTTAVGTPLKHETAKRLPKCKVSSTAADTCVYGIFAGHYDDGDSSIEALGAGIILIAQGTTVSRGDLLESAGDGTARPQSDTTIKSSTIAKVTSTIKVKEYDDGSYCVPCTLMCG